jgi:hypothetical protein
VNTVTDLRAELRHLADGAAAEDVEFRRALDVRIASQTRRRRALTLAAAAAAVVVVAGGTALAIHAVARTGPFTHPATNPSNDSHAPTVILPSVLPTNPITLPAPSTTVAVEALPPALPFGFTNTKRGFYSSWTVTADRAVGEASVGISDSLVVGGDLMWNRDGLTGVPDGAERVTIAGHGARVWRTPTSSGIETHVGWTLPDGSGLQLSNGPEQASGSTDQVKSLESFAGTITDSSIPVPAWTPVPARGIGAYSHLYASFVVGTGLVAPDAYPAGDNSTSTVQTLLCGSVAPLQLGPPAENCVNVIRGESAVAYGTLGAAATVATIDGQKVYVSADRTAVTRVTGPHSADTLVVGRGVDGVGASDLAAILLSIPAAPGS